MACESPASPSAVPPSFVPRTQIILELAAREAEAGDSVNTLHLLLGLARNRPGVASQLLRTVGLDEEEIRAGALVGAEANAQIQAALTGL